jgi:very-short-patch-repair endonuclease
MRGKVLLPDGVTDAPVGVSEKAFEQILEKYFPGRVNAQLRMQIPNWDGAYSTDFTISFPELGIWIDVEIDEPYDYQTGKPTHCTSDDRDRNRNSFFLNNNWIVVRFAEEQVVSSPESCCKEIALVISSVMKLNIYAKNLEAYSSLKPLPMWTQKQAKKMARANYRDKYLNRQKSKI